MLENEAWDSMRDLATYAQKWVADGAYQETANLYFGQDSAKHHGRIISELELRVAMC